MRFCRRPREDMVVVFTTLQYNTHGHFPWGRQKQKRLEGTTRGHESQTLSDAFTSAICRIYTFLHHRQTRVKGPRWSFHCQKFAIVTRQEDVYYYARQNASQIRALAKSFAKKDSVVSKHVRYSNVSTMKFDVQGRQVENENLNNVSCQSNVLFKHAVSCIKATSRKSKQIDQAWNFKLDSLIISIFRQSMVSHPCPNKSKNQEIWRLISTPVHICSRLEEAATLNSLLLAIQKY